MPTLWKHPESKFWFAKITLPDGRRTSRTTKQTDRNAAMQTAFAMEKLASLARKNELTQSALVKLANDLCEQIGAPAVARKSIDETCREFLSAGKAEWSDGTLKRYTSVVDDFLEFLGASRVRASLGSLTAREIDSFRSAEIASGKGITTANYGIRVLRGILKGPMQRGEIPTNPALLVEAGKGGAQERQPFDAAELKSMLKEAKGTDWEGMILFGGHCGIRLADAAHLTWSNVDIADRKVEFKPTKTGKPVAVALHSEVVTWLKKRPRGGGKTPLFPTLVHNKTGSAGGLSNAFSALMEKANVSVPLGEQRTGKGRTFRAKGFHGLRHTMVSRMANADVSGDVRKAIAGHSTDEQHERYVHLNVETQRRAVARMPKLGEATKGAAGKGSSSP